MAKIGESIAGDFFDRGRRELGQALYPSGQSVAEPAYPSRPGFSVAKEAAEQTAQEESALDKKLAEVSREEPGHEDRERGEPEIDR